MTEIEGRAIAFKLAVGIGLLGMLLVGCGGQREAQGEPSLATQIAAVEAGQSDQIQLIDTLVDDDDLAALPPLPGLRMLRLERCKLTDAAFSRLETQTGLEVLILGDTRCTGDGLAQLATLSSLRTLNLDRSEVDDAALSHLAGLRELEMLRFGSSQIIGDGLVHLAGLPKLRHLILQQAPLTDAGLAHLKPLAGLESLYLEGTQVTETGLAELRQAIPELHVHW